MGGKRKVGVRTNAGAEGATEGLYSPDGQHYCRRSRTWQAGKQGRETRRPWGFAPLAAGIITFAIIGGFGMGHAWADKPYRAGQDYDYTNRTMLAVPAKVKQDGGKEAGGAAGQVLARPLSDEDRRQLRLLRTRLEEQIDAVQQVFEDLSVVALPRTNPAVDRLATTLEQINAILARDGHREITGIPVRSSDTSPGLQLRADALDELSRAARTAIAAAVDFGQADVDQLTALGGGSGQGSAAEGEAPPSGAEVEQPAQPGQGVEVAAAETSEPALARTLHDWLEARLQEIDAARADRSGRTGPTRTQQQRARALLVGGLTDEETQQALDLVDNRNLENWFASQAGISEEAIRYGNIFRLMADAQDHSGTGVADQLARALDLLPRVMRIEDSERRGLCGSYVMAAVVAAAQVTEPEQLAGLTGVGSSVQEQAQEIRDGGPQLATRLLNAAEEAIADPSVAIVQLADFITPPRPAAPGAPGTGQGPGPVVVAAEQPPIVATPPEPAVTPAPTPVAVPLPAGPPVVAPPVVETVLATGTAIPALVLHAGRGEAGLRAVPPQTMLQGFHSQYQGRTATAYYFWFETVQGRDGEHTYLVNPNYTIPGEPRYIGEVIQVRRAGASTDSSVLVRVERNGRGEWAPVLSGTGGRFRAEDVVCEIATDGGGVAPVVADMPRSQLRRLARTAYQDGEHSSDDSSLGNGLTGLAGGTVRAYVVLVPNQQ